MTEPRKIAIAMPYDDWGCISGALAEYAMTSLRPDLLDLAAMIERSIGNSAVAGATESAAARMWVEIGACAVSRRL